MNVHTILYSAHSLILLPLLLFEDLCWFLFVDVSLLFIRLYLYKLYNSIFCIFIHLLYAVVLFYFNKKSWIDFSEWDHHE